MRNLESKTQQAYFEWARRHPVARCAFAIPNGGARSKVTAAILKAEGVLAGVSDVFLPLPVGRAHGLWIEFKHGKNGLTDEQKDFLNNRAAHGYCVAVAYDAELAVRHTIRYLRGELEPGDFTVLKKVSARQPKTC